MKRSVKLTDVNGDTLTILEPYDIWLLTYNQDKNLTQIRFRNNSGCIVRESAVEIEAARNEALGIKD